MRKRVAVATGMAVATIVIMLVGTAGVAAASANGGVTSSAIRIGVPYIDFSSLAAEGVKLTQGSFPDAYGALIANMNAHGGVNGRKIVAYYAPVNLANGTVGVDAVCTTLTEDHTIFLAMAPYEPNCYVVNHSTPTVNATFEGAAPVATAPNFTLTPPANAYRVQLHQGRLRPPERRVPGSGGPVSFGPRRDYAIGPVYVGKYSAALNQLVFSPTPAAS